MYRDLTELRQFYYSHLGHLTTQAIQSALSHFWPEYAEDSTLQVIGVGYAVPYLREDSRDIAVMTATQGGTRWPAHGANRTIVTEDYILPFAENCADRLLMIHAIENADYMRELICEAWRLLSPQGRLIIIVPNRRGIWSRSDKTPFGQGRPFTMKQLRHLFRETDFVIERHQRSLYFFPSHNRLLCWLAPLCDRFLSRLLPKFGGVLIVEASKRLYHLTPLPIKNTATRVTTPVSAWSVSDPVPS